MAKGDNPISLTGNMHDMARRSFEQSRKTMEHYADLFLKTMKASPLFDANLNKTTDIYIEKNIAAVNEFVQKLSQAKDVHSLWQIQKDFIQAQWNNYIEQMKDISGVVVKKTKDAFKEK